MRNLLLLLTLTWISPLTTRAQTSPDREQQEIRQTVIQLFEGFSAFDINQISAYCTTDVKILEDGVIWNLDSLRVNINRGKGRNIKRVNTLDFTQTQLQGKTAWTTYHNRADFTRDGKQVTRQWLESAVLIKEGKTWKVTLLHSTVIEPAKN